VLQHTSLTDFCGIPLLSLRDNSITELGLSGSGVSAPGAIVLSSLLKTNSSLRVPVCFCTYFAQGKRQTHPSDLRTCAWSIRRTGKSCVVRTGELELWVEGLGSFRMQARSRGLEAFECELVQKVRKLARASRRVWKLSNASAFAVPEGLEGFRMRARPEGPEATIACASRRVWKSCQNQFALQSFT
jgi:hypothetical protein